VSVCMCECVCVCVCVCALERAYVSGCVNVMWEECVWLDRIGI